MSLLTGLVPSPHLTRAKRAMEGSGVRVTRLLDDAGRRAPVRAAPKLPRKEPGEKMRRVRAYLVAHPEASRRVVAAACGCSRPTVDAVRAALRAEGVAVPRHVTKAERLFDLIKADGTLTAAGYAAQLNTTAASVHSLMQELRKAGRLRRVMRLEVVDA